MKVKCVSPRLNHVHFAKQADGSRKAVRIRPGDTFEVKAIPAEWEGLVVPVDGSEKKAATSSGTKEQSNSPDAKKPS